MHVTQQQKKKGQIEFGIIYGGIALVALCTARLFPLCSVLPACAVKGITGIPCPTCGSTRAIVHLAQGDIAAALLMNPLVSACVLGACLYFIYSLITLKPGIPRFTVVISERERMVLQVGIVVALVVNWMYLIATL